MERFLSESDPVKPILKEMEVGDVVHYPISRLSVISASTSTIGLELGRKYQAVRNKKMKTIVVKRLS